MEWLSLSGNWVVGRVVGGERQGSRLAERKGVQTAGWHYRSPAPSPIAAPPQPAPARLPVPDSPRCGSSGRSAWNHSAGSRLHTPIPLFPLPQSCSGFHRELRWISSHHEENERGTTYTAMRGE